MRVIIRFSLNRDRKSKLRNTLKPLLEAQGIIWTGQNTGTYEGDVSEAQIRRALNQFWMHLANNISPAHLDHFWMYTDKTPATLKGAVKSVRALHQSG